MQGEVVDALPLVVLLAPDKDLAVVRRRGQDGAVLGVCLGFMDDETVLCLILLRF